MREGEKKRKRKIKRKKGQRERERENKNNIVCVCVLAVLTSGRGVSSGASLGSKCVCVCVCRKQLATPVVEGAGRSARGKRKDVGPRISHTQMTPSRTHEICGKSLTNRQKQHGTPKEGHYQFWRMSSCTLAVVLGLSP